MAFRSQEPSGTRQREERWERSILGMIVAAAWRKNEGDAQMDGERFKGDVVMMDKDCEEKLKME